MDTTESFVDEDGSELPFEEWDTIAQLDAEGSCPDEGTADPELGTAGGDIPFENWDSPTESDPQSSEPTLPARRTVLKLGSVVFGSLAVGPLLEAEVRNETAEPTREPGHERFGYGGRPVDDDTVRTTTHGPQTRTAETQPQLTEDTEPSTEAVPVTTEATTASAETVRTPDTIETTTAPSLTPIETIDGGTASAESSTGGFGGDERSGGGGSGSGGGTTTTTATPRTLEATRTPTETTSARLETDPGRALGKQGYGQHGYGGVATQ